MIVYLEDTRYQSDWVMETLQDVLKVEVIPLETEREFEEQIDDLLGKEPKLFLLDMMVDYDFQRPDETGERKESSWFAGARCAKLVRDKGCNVPIVIHSILRKNEHQTMAKDIAATHLTGVTYIEKDTPIDELVKTVRKLMTVGA